MSEGGPRTGPDADLVRARAELARRPDDVQVWHRLVATRARSGDLLAGLREVRSRMLSGLAPLGSQDPGAPVPPSYQAFLCLVATSGYGVGDPGATSSEPVRMVASDGARGRVAVLRAGNRLEILELRRYGTVPALALAWEVRLGWSPQALACSPQDGSVWMVGLDGSHEDGRLRHRSWTWSPADREAEERELGAPLSHSYPGSWRFLGASGDGRRLLLTPTGSWDEPALVVIERDAACTRADAIVETVAPGGIAETRVDPGGRVALVVVNAGDSPLGGTRIRSYRMDLATGAMTRLSGADQRYADWGFGRDGEPIAWGADPTHGREVRVGPDGCVVPEGDLLEGPRHGPPGRVALDRVAREGFPWGVAQGGPSRRPTVRYGIGDGSGTVVPVVVTASGRELRVLLPEEPLPFDAFPASPWDSLTFLGGGRMLAAMAAGETVLYGWPGGEVLGRSPPEFHREGLRRDWTGHLHGLGAKALRADSGPALESSARWVLGGPRTARPPYWEADMAFPLLDLRTGIQRELVARDLPVRQYHIRLLAPDAAAVVVLRIDGEIMVFRPERPIEGTPQGAVIPMRCDPRFRATVQGAEAAGFMEAPSPLVYAAADPREGVVAFDLEGNLQHTWPGIEFSGSVQTRFLRPHPVLGLVGLGPEGLLALSPGRREAHRFGPDDREILGFSLSSDARTVALALAEGRIEVRRFQEPATGPGEAFAWCEAPQRPRPVFELGPEGATLLVSEGTWLRMHPLG